MQEVLEYCLGQRMAIRSLPRGMGDEWEVEFLPESHIQAVALGMFLRDHKLELVGFGTPSPAPIQKPKPKRTEKRVDQLAEVQGTPSTLGVGSSPMEFRVQNDNSISPVNLSRVEEEMHNESGVSPEGNPAGFGLFEGENEEAPFS